MAIEYVEIRNANREIIGLIDTANSVIWHSVYFGVGDFEIYVAATPENVALLKENNYVTRPNDIEVGIIESIQIIENAQDGRMIVAAGTFAKSLLSRRLIYRLAGTSNSVTVLRGNVETAVREVVKNNAINCTWNPRRNFPILALGAAVGLPAKIVDESGTAAEKQVSYQNLLEYSDNLLTEYGYGATITLDTATKKLLYNVYAGVDHSINNAGGTEAIIFSTEYDNITESEYSYDSANYKNVALIGGEGEGTERFYSVLYDEKSGLNRREEWVDAKSINKTLKATDLQELFPSGVFSGTQFKVNGTVYANLKIDEEKEYTLNSLQERFPSGVVSGTKFNVSGVTYANLIYGEETKYKATPIGYKAILDADEDEGNYILTNTVYSNLLKAQGMQDLAQLTIVENFTGSINDLYGNWHYNEDFMLGDIVTIQNNELGKYVNVRIVECTEVQDENGYKVDPTYESI